MGTWKLQANCFIVGPILRTATRGKHAQVAGEEIVSKVKSDSIWQELYNKAAEHRALEGRITVLVTYKDGMLFRKGKVWIPSDLSLRKLIMESEHDS